MEPYRERAVRCWCRLYYRPSIAWGTIAPRRTRRAANNTVVVADKFSSGFVISVGVPQLVVSVLLRAAQLSRLNNEKT
jgi:hypothetical protein